MSRFTRLSEKSFSDKYGRDAIALNISKEIRLNWLN